MAFGKDSVPSGLHLHLVNQLRGCLLAARSLTGLTPRRCLPLLAWTFIPVLARSIRIRDGIRHFSVEGVLECYRRAEYEEREPGGMEAVGHHATVAETACAAVVWMELGARGLGAGNPEVRVLSCPWLHTDSLSL